MYVQFTAHTTSALSASSKKDTAAAALQVCRNKKKKKTTRVLQATMLRLPCNAFFFALSFIFPVTSSLAECRPEAFEAR